ncbi:MAG: Hsp70 family protein, partial [candidate division NC10 bacterium]
MVIPRNTPLPARAGRIFTTAADYQTSMDIHVLQGERELAVDNISLGQFRLDGLPPGPRGYPKVEVTFEADVDGIVHVCATDLLSENEAKVTVASTKLLDAREIRDLSEEARLKAEQDRENRERIQAGIEAGSALAAAEMALAGTSLGPEENEVLEGAIRQLREALPSEDTAKIRTCNQRLRQLLAGLSPKSSGVDPLSWTGERPK